jgi:hypothetical protein
MAGKNEVKEFSFFLFVTKMLMLIVALNLVKKLATLVDVDLLDGRIYDIYDSIPSEGYIVFFLIATSTYIVYRMGRNAIILLLPVTLWLSSGIENPIKGMDTIYHHSILLICVAWSSMRIITPLVPMITPITIALSFVFIGLNSDPQIRMYFPLIILFSGKKIMSKGRLLVSIYFHRNLHPKQRV